MSIQAGGYAGLALSSALIAAVTSESLLYVGVLLGILVAVSTLMLRWGSMIERSVRGVIHEMQIKGELPLSISREETQGILEEINQSLSDLKRSD